MHVGREGDHKQDAGNDQQEGHGVAAGVGKDAFDPPAHTCAGQHAEDDAAADGSDDRRMSIRSTEAGSAPIAPMPAMVGTITVFRFLGSACYLAPVVRRTWRWSLHSAQGGFAVLD